MQLDINIFFDKLNAESFNILEHLEYYINFIYVFFFIKPFNVCFFSLKELGYYILSGFDISHFFYLYLAYSFFGTGLFGVFLNRRNLIIILLFFELILLSVNFNFLNFSLILDNSVSQLISIYILIIAGSEAAIGLAFVILTFQTKGVLNLDFLLGLKG